MAWPAVAQVGGVPKIAGYDAVAVVPGVDAHVGVQPLAVPLHVAVPVAQHAAVERTARPAVDQRPASVLEAVEVQQVPGPDQLRVLGLLDPVVEQGGAQVQRAVGERLVDLAVELVQHRPAAGVARGAEALQQAHRVELRAGAIELVRPQREAAVVGQAVVRPHHAQAAQAHVHVVALRSVRGVGRRARPEVPEQPGPCSHALDVAAHRLGGVHQVHADPQVQHRLAAQDQVLVAALLERPELARPRTEGAVLRRGRIVQDAQAVLAQSRRLVAFGRGQRGGRLADPQTLARERKPSLAGGDEHVVQVDRAVASFVEPEGGVLDVVLQLTVARRARAPFVAEDVVGGAAGVRHRAERGARPGAAVAAHRQHVQSGAGLVVVQAVGGHQEVLVLGLPAAGVLVPRQ